MDINTVGPIFTLILLVIFPFLMAYLKRVGPSLAEQLPLNARLIAAAYLLVLMFYIVFIQQNPYPYPAGALLLAAGVGLWIYLKSFIDPLQGQSITVDNNSRASNPGALRVSYLHWARAFPTGPISITLLFVLFAALAVTVNWFFWIPFALVIPVAALILIRTREHFVSGCVNPAVVVSQDPCLVAVCTDLSTGMAGSYPVIKVLPQPLKHMPGGAPKVGTRLAAVALYYGTGEGGHWDGFDPVVINCVTGNRQDIDRVFSTISIADWKELGAGLKQVRTPRTPGLYPVSFPPAQP